MLPLQLGIIWYYSFSSLFHIKFLSVLKKKKVYLKKIYKFHGFLMAYRNKPQWDWVLSKAIKVNTNNTALVLCYQSLALWLRLSTRVSTSRGRHLSTGTEQAEVTDLSHSALQTDVWVTTLSHCKRVLEPNQVESTVSPF